MTCYFYGKDVSEMDKRQINKLFREHDESNLWPINGRFNATERAIRRIRERGLCDGGGVEYAYVLDHEISQIVNDPKLQ